MVLEHGDDGIVASFQVVFHMLLRYKIAREVCIYIVKLEFKFEMRMQLLPAKAE